MPDGERSARMRWLAQGTGRRAEFYAKPVAFTDKDELQGIALGTTMAGSVVYTDEAAAYEGMLERSHRTVKHSVGEYVKRQASTNGIESFGR